MDDHKKELYNISNQMVEMFIKDVFSKNEVNTEKAKSNISDEQKEALKQSVNQLKEQVETFLYEKKAKKTVNENEEETQQESPLREWFMNRHQEESD